MSDIYRYVAEVTLENAFLKGAILSAAGFIIYKKIKDYRSKKAEE